MWFSITFVSAPIKKGMDMERQAADFLFNLSRARCGGINWSQTKNKIKVGSLFCHEVFVVSVV